MLTLLGIGYFFLINQRKSARAIRDLFQEPVVVSRKKQDCFTIEGLSYLSYKEVPEDERRNNKFGLYIYAENRDFMELAQQLINSNGGDWGYVLIPYNVRDRDYSKWSSVFKRLNSKHLIPIIQLWDLDLDDYENETEEAAEFLDSFAWPIKQRYISVYNEPNDSKFWYENANPEEYARILDYTLDTFKDQNSNYFMLNGALNVSAHDGKGYVDAFDYMYRMNQEIPGIFSKLDGWASHSYPQPNFSGRVDTPGRNGIRAYETELAYLQDTLGVKKDLPVFITETGWAHAEGAVYNSTYLPVDEISRRFRQAFEDYWLPDDRVRAVTPFTIWYPAPFDHFSWVNKDNVPYKHYEVIKSMDKIEGNNESLEAQSTDILECN